MSTSTKISPARTSPAGHRPHTHRPHMDKQQGDSWHATRIGDGPQARTKQDLPGSRSLQRWEARYLPHTAPAATAAPSATTAAAALEGSLL